MSKRNVMFSKPDEPAFLKRMKQEIGYKETCSIDTKFENSPTGPEDHSDEDTEKPQIVVLKPGDLTEQEAEEHNKKLQKELESKPADLNERVIFNAKKKDKDSKTEKPAKKDKKQTIPVKLSFEDDDDDEEEA